MSTEQSPETTQSHQGQSIIYTNVIFRSGSKPVLVIDMCSNRKNSSTIPDSDQVVNLIVNHKRLIKCFPHDYQTLNANFRRYRNDRYAHIPEIIKNLKYRTIESDHSKFRVVFLDDKSDIHNSANRIDSVVRLENNECILAHGDDVKNISQLFATRNPKSNRRVAKFITHENPDYVWMFALRSDQLQLIKYLINNKHRSRSSRMQFKIEQSGICDLPINFLDISL